MSPVTSECVVCSRVKSGFPLRLLSRPPLSPDFVPAPHPPLPRARIHDGCPAACARCQPPAIPSAPLRPSLAPKSLPACAGWSVRRSVRACGAINLPIASDSPADPGSTVCSRAPAHAVASSRTDMSFAGPMLVPWGAGSAHDPVCACICSGCRRGEGCPGLPHAQTRQRGARVLLQASRLADTQSFRIFHR